MEPVTQRLYGIAWADQIWGDSLNYIKTVVDTAHDPFLILDEQLRILAANKAFYKLFRIDGKNIEPRYINEIGNGVWNIHTLGALLAGILPKKTFFSGIEVSSEFPSLSRKIMLLNGQHHYGSDGNMETFSPMILLTIENNTQMAVIIAELADYSFRIKRMLNGRTQILESEIRQLKKYIDTLKTGEK